MANAMLGLSFRVELIAQSWRVFGSKGITQRKNPSRLSCPLKVFIDTSRLRAFAADHSTFRRDAKPKARFCQDSVITGSRAHNRHNYFKSDSRKEIFVTLERPKTEKVEKHPRNL